MNLTNLEKAVLEAAIVSSRPEFEKLKAQIATLKIKDRELTGVGFFTEFEAVDEIFKAQCDDFEISDVEGKLNGLNNGFGCVVFIKDGQIDTVECFSYDEPWPDHVDQFAVSKAIGI